MCMSVSKMIQITLGAQSGAIRASQWQNSTALSARLFYRLNARLKEAKPAELFVYSLSEIKVEPET